MIFYSESLNHSFSFLAAIEIDFMFFEVETRLLISPIILVPQTFLFSKFEKALYATNISKRWKFWDNSYRFRDHFW